MAQIMPLTGLNLWVVSFHPSFHYCNNNKNGYTDQVAT